MEYQKIYLTISCLHVIGDSKLVSCGENFIIKSVPCINQRVFNQISTNKAESNNAIRGELFGEGIIWSLII